jgi:putative OPT family oligopeptide transporter
MVPEPSSRLELTWRGVALGALITLAFTAANVFLGLKVGLTFASSIPAAVISMAVLRAFKNATIFENNIVQTVASAAGTLSSIIFVLPGLVMVGWWTGFPFWESFVVCATGGILGVMYSVPLRRALVTNSDLPYPEGVAAAEVLKVGVSTHGETSPAAIEENRKGLIALTLGAIVSAVYAAIAATRIFTDTVAGYFRAGAASTGFGLSMSLALVGAGHLMGITVGMAILTGLVIAWAVLVPVMSVIHPLAGDATTVALTTWSHQVRFVGAGVIGISGIWTLLRLAKPVVTGVTSALAAQRVRQAAASAGEAHGLPRTERDIPIGIVALISLLCFIPIAVLLGIFLNGTALASLTLPLIIAGVIYIFVAGFFVATATGYMAGLIGSSSSPVSGMAILSVVGAALVLLVVGKTAGPNGAPALVAYALFVTAVLMNVATISNDNLQDLKTGQLVDATPWRQQVALAIGVIFGALVIPPVLNLLNAAYGFGAAGGAHALPAPQATLISTLAKGVIQGQIDWGLIGIGAAIGAGVIAVDEALRAFTPYRLPPLGVGLGVYLPSTATAPLVVGALIGLFYNRWVAKTPYGDVARRLGVLVASGLIVGESLFGVLLAGIIVASKGNATPLALVGDSFQVFAMPLAGVAFAAAIFALYRWVERLAKPSTAR